MKLQDFRQQIPQLNGLSDADALDILHKNYYPTVDKQRMADVLGVSMAKPVAPASERTVLQTMGDMAITGVKGAIGLTEIPVGLANIVTGGAAGKLAEELGYRPEEAKAMLDGAYSDPQKEAFARVQQADGFMGKLSAAVENPSVIAHTVAESVPSMLAGGVAARGLMGVGAAGGAAPGVMARAFGQSAPLVAGAAGEGLMATGSAAEQIRQQTADGYLTGEQSGLAAASGAATSLFGVLGGKIAKRLGVGDVDTMLAGAARDPAMRKGVVRSFLEGAATEGVLEELPQSISEQVLQNLALGKPLDEGVDQAAAMGLLAGGAMGGGAGAMGTFGRAPGADPAADAATAEADAIRATKPQGDGPLSKAVGAGIEAEAQKVEAAPVLGARLSSTPMADMLGGAGMTGTDPLAGMLSADRQQQENTAVRMGQFVDRNQAMLTGGGLTGNADPVAGMIAGARESDATSETNIRNFAQSRSPMVASDAARVLDEAKTRGLDFTAAPHPEGGFMVVPRQWVMPAVGQRAEAEIADTLNRMAQADAAPVERAPRARAEAVDLTMPTADPVRDYVDGMRKVNTPAAKFYVSEFDAGRITPADVQQRMTVERGKTPDERLADAAAQAPKSTAQPGDLLNPKGEPFKTLMSARLAAKKTPGDVIEVVGGYSVRPKTEVSNAQAAPVPAGQPQADAGTAPSVEPVPTPAQAQPVAAPVARQPEQAQPLSDAKPVAVDAGVKDSLTADSIARALTDSIGRNAIKNNDKYWDEQVKKGYAAPDRAETGKRQGRETWEGSKVSERTQKLAAAIADKDPRPLVEAWARDGQGTSGSEGSMDGFKELTGINLKKLNSAARAKAIYDWAGWDDARVAADVAQRNQATSQRKAEQEAKAQADADGRTDRVASTAPLGTKDGKEIGTVKSWVDDLVGQGFTELRQIKKGAITKTFLANPATGAGYPMPTGLLREYAEVATRRAKSAPTKPDMGNPTSAPETPVIGNPITSAGAGNPATPPVAEIPATTPASDNAPFEHNGLKIRTSRVKVGEEVQDRWVVDGDDQKFGPLALAKKRGMEIGMAKAKQEGFVVMSAIEQALGADYATKPVDKAAKLRNEAEALAKEAAKMLDGIVPGQPVMSVRDRNLRERSGEKMRKAGELLKEADALDAAKAGEVAAKPEPKKAADLSARSVDWLRANGGETITVTEALAALEKKRSAIVDDKANWTERDAKGHPVNGIQLYTPEARRKLDANAWAVTNLLEHKKKYGDAPRQKVAAAQAEEKKIPVSEAIDKVNAKYGKGLTDADRVPEQKPASKTPAMDAHAALMDAVRTGKATPEQFKAGFEAVVAGADAIKAELGTHTKPDLLKMGGPYMRMRYASENKPEIIDALYREMLGEFLLGESLTYGMGKNSYRDAIAKRVETVDADKLAKYVAERKAAIEEAAARRVAAAQAVADPKTLDDFKAAIRAAMLEGKTRKEAYLTLTPEQRIRFDELDAESTREARETRKRAQKTQVQAAGQTTGGQIIATKHTRDGYDLFVVQLSDRLSKEDYSTVLASAKRMGGWYSAFRGNGATPGFQFKEKSSAEAFLKLAGGDTTAAQDQAAQRRDAFEDDRSQTAAERLTEMADRLEVQADEELGRDRKANTARRARFAASAEKAASNVKALAKTMRNIATAIGEGKAKFLDAVRQKTQVEMLAGVVHTAKYNELVARFPEYADREKRNGEPPTIGTADFAEFPTFTAFRSDLASLARQMLEVDGTKKLGQQLMGVADDVTDAYLDFAKKNLHLVSTFKLKDGSGAIFSSKETGANAIRRSGLTGKAILLPVKRGENVVVMSPSEAMNRGVWKGDGDKRITLTKDAGMELVQAIGRKGNQSNGLKVPWQFETAADRLKALSRMGIETPSEFRSAVREFISLRVQAQEADRVKAMERAMVGRKADGLDFFPTPAEVADQMVEAAGIEPDMAVLEPSAGMGHLADRIRAAGAEPDVVELSGDRRELLEEKGFTVVGTDFMQMKPRTFFTYGDVFSAPDGKEGVMRGQGGMGSDRVRLVDDAGQIIGYYNRDELTGVRHGGTESGYDRIIMNPPFGDRRDAEHVRHAYSLLKPGGRLVAIMGEGVFFGKDKKAEDFREWLDTLGGTSEKLPEGSFMDPSLPVTTGVNARMVVVDKPAGAVVFAQSLSTVAPGQGVSRQAAEDAVEKALDGLGMRGVVTPKIFQNTLAAGLGPTPSGVVPSGGNTGGEVYLFLDGIGDQAEAFRVVFHELFHLGLSQSVKPSAYIPTMLQFLRDPLVSQYANKWKKSADGQSRLGTIPANNWHALAVEEALADIAEEINAERGGLGTKDMQGWVKRTISWLANLAQRWGLPSVASRLRGMTYTEAEAFVQATMLKGRTGSPTLLPDTRFRSVAGGAESTQAEAFSVKGATADQLAHYRGMGMQVLGRRQIVDLYGDMLPELKQYDTLVQRMDADKNESGAEADALVNDWAKLDERGALGVGLAKHPGMERKLAELMHDATLAQIDPAKPLQRGDDPGAHKALVTKFEALSPKAQEVYRTARDMYANHFKKVQAAIQDRIQRSGMDETSKAKMIAKMDADLFNKLKGVYFPLARFGKYVVVSKNAAGETVSVSRAETLGEANKMRREVVKNSPPGVTVSRVYKDAEFNASRDAVGKGFVSDLMTMLQGQGVGEDVLDSVGQLYLSSLPDLSWAKHGIHRKGTPGFSQDARRAFAQNMFHGARHLAKLRYSDQLADKLMDMEERVKDQRDEEGFDPIKAQQVVDEMNARHDELMNPKTSSLSTALTSVGFVWFLGISPASALVNLSQTALVAYPVMAAKWGFQKAGTALLSASAEVVRAGNDLSKVLKGDELAAFQKAVDDGTIDVTQAHDLAGVAQGEDERVAMAMRPVMRAASFMFHHAEKFNRQATFIAAYRLAKENGADADLAFEQAKKATYDGHFDYSASNRPRLMQGNWQKVLFLFKQYGQNMVYTLTRQAYLSMKGMTPEQRTEARKQLGGLLAMHAMAAGALGLPLVGVLLSAASMLGSDDDEPWDAEVAMKNMMADAMGPKAAEVMAHGLSRLTPWDLSGRVALNKLILPDIQEGLEGQPLWEKMVMAAAGPVAGIGGGFFKGMAEMGQGQYQRGLESMLPVALKNPVKAMRFGEEGVVDKTGVVIKDEVGMAGLLGQASGFRPSEVALATEGRTAIFQADKALTDRRSNILRMYAQARMAGDAEGVKDAMAMVQSFNAKNPTRRIAMRNLIQSVQGRNRRIEQAEQGIYLPKTRRDAMDAGRFALAE